MKIAFVSDDGEKTISAHFGRAPLYVVVEMEDGKEVARETRDKMSPHGEQACNHSGEEHGAKHGCGPGSEVKHRNMAYTIADCQALVARGMGWGAFQSLQGYGITPIVNKTKHIDEALKLYLEGKLENQMEHLH